MNIFRSKYRLIKAKLIIFGERVKKCEPRILYTAAFWKNKLDNIEGEISWDYIIIAFLAYWCNDEERRFIYEVFFKQSSVKSVTIRMYMSEAAYYSKKEKIMDCLLGLAMQEGLLAVDLKNRSPDEETACTCDSMIDDVTWKKISEIILRKAKRITPSMRVAVEAMLYVFKQKIPWREMPARFGSWKTVYNRYLRWKKSGLWIEIYKIL